MSEPLSPKGIKAWSEEDRPREKLMQKGVDSLSDSELLAILIGSGSRSVSAVDLCKSILASCNYSLDDLSRYRMTDLTKFNGIGEAKAITIIAAMELGRRRILKGKQEEVFLTSSKEAYHCIGPQLMDLPHEEFWVLLLNTNKKLIKKIQISSGGMSSVVVDPKIIFRHALDNVATGLILIHNHPSGNLKPSRADDHLTEKMISGGKLLDIHIHDHIIICGHDYYSYLDKGMI